jgi:hypothetical protein
VAFASSSTQERRDFVELFNTSDQPLDISGLRITFRPTGSGNAPSSVTLPGAVGSGTTLIQGRGYFLVVGGAGTFGVAADFDAASPGLDLNNTTGGIKIEIAGTELDGLSYQGASTPPASPFDDFGEGSVFTFTGGTTNDLVRTPDANDTGDNAADFRRNGSLGSVTPKAANPAPP